MSETNERGNTIERAFYCNRERYHYDFKACRRKDGWKQYDTEQDAWYFGVWVHLEKRVIVTFAEGDETRVTCPDDLSLKAELMSMESFYGEPPPAAIGVDADGTVTQYFDPRPEVTP